MRKLGTTLIGLFMLGCPPQLDDPEHDGDPADLPADVLAAGTDGATGEGLLGDELQGLGIVEEEDGPWMIRRSDRGRPERDRDDDGITRSLAMPSSVATEAEASAPREGYRGSGLGGPGAAGGRAEPVEEAVAMADSMERKSMRSPSMPDQAAGPMRAGATDDNADFNEFLTFLAGWSDDAHVASQWDELDVRDRRTVRITDKRGNPAPGVQVALVDEVRDAVVWSGTTYGDGSLPFYPSVAARELDADGVQLAAPDGGYLVQVSHGDQQTRKRWNGIGDELVVEIADRQKVPATIPLDVCFLIDTTGSMGDEISRIKATLLRVTERLRDLEQEFDLHYSAVLYRDIGDEYVTKAHPFTSDIESFVDTLQGVQANGGGDGPESLNQGLAHAVSLDGWRDGAAKVMFLIADAPPHMDYAGDTPYGQSLLAAVGQGIRIHSVAASGLDTFGTVVMRQTAQFTGGKFIFIEYGSTAVSAASHGVTGSVSSNNLDDIIYQQISGELAGWGQPTSTIASR